MDQDRSFLIALLLMCLGSILIGSSAIFVRLSDLGPITTGFYRMLFALPLLAVWIQLERQKLLYPVIPLRRDMGGLCIAGIFFALDLALWNWSIDNTSIVNATLFNNTAAFFVPLIMWMVFGEKQSLRFIMAVITGFIGCSFLAGESLSISYKNLIGDLVALSSGLMVALYVIALRGIRSRMPTSSLMFWAGGFALAGLGILAYCSGEAFWPLTFRDLASILGQAVLVHTVGQSLFAYSLAKVPASYASLILFLAPVTGAGLGWAVYGEPLTHTKVLGMALVMISIMGAKKKRV